MARWRGDLPEECRCAIPDGGRSPQELARDILAVLPDVVAVLPHDEVDAVLSDLPRMTYTRPLGGPVRLTLISLLILTASVGCGKSSQSFQSCTEVCTHHYANLDPESCSGYTNDEVDDCISRCQFYVDVAGEDCSEEVHAFVDNIGDTQLSCGWWEDCTGGYDDTCDGYSFTPAIDDCMRDHGESSDFPDDHPDYPWYSPY